MPPVVSKLIELVLLFLRRESIEEKVDNQSHVDKTQDDINYR